MNLSLPGIEAEIGTIDRDSWCTPECVWSIPLRAEHRGAYDLDPCSNARSTVPALREICPPRDGLADPWDAEVIWMNPPYSDVGPWFEHASRHWRSRVWGVVPLSPGIMAWQDHGPDFFWPLGRVRFVPPIGIAESSPTQEHALVLWSRTMPPILPLLYMGRRSP